MSLSVTTDVFCDSCGDWVHGIVAGGKLPWAARKAAKDQGWVFVKVGDKWQDLCAVCKPPQPLKKEANREQTD